MKTLVDILSTVFLIVGVCVGAGFITGRELVSFFGTENFIPPLIIFGVTFCAFLFAVVSVAKNKPSLGVLNSQMLSRPKLFDASVTASCFLSVSAMLSAIDALTVSINPTGFPIYSLLAILLLNPLSRNGIRGVKVVNAVLIPLILVSLNAVILLNGRLILPTAKPVEINGVGKALLYSTMNIFVNLPPIVDGARAKSKPKLLAVCVISSLILVAQAVLVLGAIKGYGVDLSSFPTPFISAIDGKYSVIFSVFCLLCIFTSLTSAYYPLYEKVKCKSKRYGGIILAIFCFAFSRIGVKNIIDYAYPLIGALGGVYVINCIIYGLKNNEKTKRTKTKRGKKTAQKTTVA